MRDTSLRPISSVKSIVRSRPFPAKTIFSTSAECAFSGMMRVSREKAAPALRSISRACDSTNKASKRASGASTGSRAFVADEGAESASTRASAPVEPLEPRKRLACLRGNGGNVFGKREYCCGNKPRTRGVSALFARLCKRTKADDQFVTDGGTIRRCLHRGKKFFLPTVPCGGMACGVAHIRVGKQEESKCRGFAVMRRRGKRPCNGRNGRMERKQKPQVTLGKQDRKQLLLHGRGTIV